MTSNCFLLLVLAVAVVIIPAISVVTGNLFILTLTTRILLLSIAAVGLQLLVGYGNLISLGHALFVGLGGYVVAVCTYYVGAKPWLGNGFVQLGILMATAAVVGTATGYVSLRTRGIHFLMITLAFGQMFQLLAVSAPAFGGDDGMTLYERPWLPWIDLASPYQRYALIATVLLACIVLVARIVRSRFGLVLRASATNEARLQSSGYDVHRLRLAAYVVSGLIAAVAGYLSALHTEFVSPAAMSWVRSGDLVIMVVLGGRLVPGGPVLGAAILVLVEEVASRYTESSSAVLGLLVILIARTAGSGVALRGGMALPGKSLRKAA